MSVTAARGFVASGVHSGIRRSGPDLAVVRSTARAVGAAVWTTNRVLAAPVVVSKRHLDAAEPQAVVINAGVANAATGETGIADAELTAAETASALGLRPEEVVVLSTGVIGVPLPMDRVLAGVREASAALVPDGGEGAATAILTTDRWPKQATVEGDGFVVGGMAKGAGMIHPRLATMLAVVTTDYPLAPGEPIDFLRPAVDASFNRISVDGECSTNDAVRPARERREWHRTHGCARRAVGGGTGRGLRRAGARDRRRRRGRDGAPRDRGVGRRVDEEAEAVARRIATSPLVKTAAFGRDPNWGRVLAAAGSAPWNGGFARVETDRLSVSFDGAPVFVRGEPTGATPVLGGSAVSIDLDLGLGDGSASYLASDLTVDYVRLNAEYTTLMRLVLKLGGRIAGDSTALALDRHDTGDEVVVVHGAGPQITAELQARGIPVTFVDGRRFTDSETLAVVRTSLVAVGAELAAALGPAAMHLVGDEIGLEALRIAELGFVGEPLPCAPAAIEEALADRRIPVVTPVAVRPAERQCGRGSDGARGGARRRTRPLRLRRPGRLPRGLGRAASARRRRRRAPPLGRVRGRHRPEALRGRPRSPARDHRGDRGDGGGGMSVPGHTVSQGLERLLPDVRARRPDRRPWRGVPRLGRRGPRVPRLRRRDRRRVARPLPSRPARRGSGAARAPLARLEPLPDRAGGAARLAALRPLRRSAGVLLQLGRRGGRGGAEVRTQGDREGGRRRPGGWLPRAHLGRTLGDGAAGQARAVRAAPSGCSLRPAERRRRAPRGRRRGGRAHPARADTRRGRGHPARCGLRGSGGRAAPPPLPRRGADRCGPHGDVLRLRAARRCGRIS